MRILKPLALALALALVPAGVGVAASHHARPGHHASKKKPPKHKHKPKPKPKPLVVKNGGPFPGPNPLADLTTPCANTDVVATSANLADVQAAILCLTNQERAKQGIGALTANATLASVAQTYAGVVVSANNFSHTGPDGSAPDDRVLGAGYVAPNGNYEVGENLGVAEGPLATAGNLMAAWMNSPEHRANILDPGFRELGVGIALGVPASQSTGAGGGATFVQDFGVRGTDLVKKRTSSSAISLG